MKILIINELRLSGGTEIQTKREYDYFTMKGHEVYLLTFDPKYDRCVVMNDQKYFNLPVRFSDVQKSKHRLLSSQQYRKDLKEILEAVSPEYIHINVIKNLPIDVYSVVMDYPTIQTIRDYEAVCPKGTCIYPSGELCAGYKNTKCWKCIKKNIKDFVKLISLCRVNHIRRNTVNAFISPSQALADMCTRNNISTSCVNNPFDFSILKSKEVSYQKLVYLYYGKISAEKGVSILINAFKKFHEYYSSSELWIIGNVDKVYKNEFVTLMDSESIKYKGTMSNDEIMDIYKEIYCVVVPSLWIENYPNTVLEALANHTLVIGSNRGGIPEMIQNDDLLFNILDINDVVKKLEHTANLTDEQYKSIVDQSYARVSNNNTLEKYYEKLTEKYVTLTT